MRQEDQYRAIQELNQSHGYSIQGLCDIYDIARSAYYKWLNRLKPFHEIENEKLLTLICEIYEEHDGILGYRQMTINLYRDYDWTVNHKRVYRLMKVAGIQSVCRKKRKNYVRCTPEIIAENVLNRDFKADSIHEKWLTDVTEFKYGNGKKAYLSAILDLGDRSIIAYTFGRSNNNQLVFDNLDLAVEQFPKAKPIFHSDRGFQYTNRLFKEKLNKANMTQSMSRVGRCIDNGPMEGFWGILKSEMYYLKKFDWNVNTILDNFLKV